MKNQIGIDSSYSNQVVEKLNGLLSNVQVFYMNVRGFHWNITGRHFFKLHEKFEELYDDLNEKADEIAERILMLEGKPVHSFTEYLKTSEIKEKLNVSSDMATVKEVIDGLGILLKKEREIASLAAENADDGTVDLMTGYISGQEKMVWMYNAFLK
ncbi:MAG: DNA starvation/stationary phase protection protein [Bacteroidales bacterium]|nr:DNA starvation/stationary phase protection protein [Bacteroidales bacterium]MBN2762193.1 DNA starvation/stationary phase protection protein [Bacteroidales bacterium]